MQVIADLQLHSKYARAVSPNMVVGEISRWAEKKGITLVATGDWTHPLWLRELAANLEEAAPGLFRLKHGVTRGGGPHGRGPSVVTWRKGRGADERQDPLFLLSTEVSCIYTQGGRARRIHILIFAPNFATVEKINKEFSSRGANLMSDGRPIMGLSSREVAELVLGVDSRCLLIPAHAWTPWFSLYGSASGFDSIEECFGQYSKQIFAIETGLSSDPAMNWRIAELENRAIVSFSDAHSPPKLGREATVFEISDERLELSYQLIREAITGLTSNSQPPRAKIAYTIEFYPEEGKYHYTGHRNCGVKQSPEETKKRGEICPVCGRKLTVGVMHRVEELADRKMENGKWKMETDANGVRWVEHPNGNRPPYVMLVPLMEILAEALGSLPSSQKVQNEYEKLTAQVGPEFEILMRTKPEELEKLSGPKVAQGIAKVRSGDIAVDPGFDGVFGKVKIWKDEDKDDESKRVEQTGLFD